MADIDGLSDPVPITPSQPAQAAKPITVSLADLTHGTIPFSTLESAFGPTSLGIIVVSDLPPRFQTLRHQLLTHASHLSRLPATELANLTRPEAKYLVGWSHGRETLPPKSTPDFHKGSFYVNCAFVKDPALDAAPKTARFPDFPEYTSPNVWPEEHLIPRFRETFEELCRLVVDVAGLVARSVDRYAEERVQGYPERNGNGESATDGKGMGYLEAVVRGSYTTKARLLHYFPPPDDDKVNGTTNGDGTPEADDSWCTTHLDHGCLTGLLSAMYLRDGALGSASNVLADAIPCPDPSAGLYIHSRTGQPVKVSFPADTLAFQTGEALQKITAGRLRAVPHYVSPGKGRGDDGELLMKGVERNTLAVFTQPNLEDVVDLSTGECFGGFAGEVVARNTVGTVDGSEDVGR